MGDHPANGHPRKAARLSKASDSVRYPQGFLEGCREAWIPCDDSVGQEYCVGQVSQETTRTKYDGDVRLPLPPSLLPVPMDTHRVRMLSTLHCSHFFATMESGGLVSTFPFLTSSQLVLRLVPLLSW